MGGGLLQLVAYGAQDIYLTGNPQITFFKAVFRRHTNFAIESIEQTINGTVGPYNKVSFNLSRQGDLVSDIILKMTGGTNDAFSAIEYVECEIGGQVIDKQYIDWINIWCDLSQNSDKTKLLNELRRGLEIITVPLVVDENQPTPAEMNNLQLNEIITYPGGAQSQFTDNSHPIEIVRHSTGRLFFTKKNAGSQQKLVMIDVDGSVTEINASSTLGGSDKLAIMGNRIYNIQSNSSYLSKFTLTSTGDIDFVSSRLTTDWNIHQAQFSSISNISPSLINGVDTIGFNWGSIRAITANNNMVLTSGTSQDPIHRLYDNHDSHYAYPIYNNPTPADKQIIMNNGNTDVWDYNFIDGDASTATFKSSHSGPLFLTLSPDGNFAYWAPYASGIIRRMDLRDGYNYNVETILGNLVASPSNTGYRTTPIDGPIGTSTANWVTGITISSDNNTLYYVDAAGLGGKSFENHQLRKIDLTNSQFNVTTINNNIISDIATNTFPCYGIAIHPSNQYILMLATNKKIIKYDLLNNSESVWFGDGTDAHSTTSIRTAISIVFNSTGSHVYVPDYESSSAGVYRFFETDKINADPSDNDGVLSGSITGGYGTGSWRVKRIILDEPNNVLYSYESDGDFNVNTVYPGQGYSRTRARIRKHPIQNHGNQNGSEDLYYSVNGDGLAVFHHDPIFLKNDCLYWIGSNTSQEGLIKLPIAPVSYIYPPYYLKQHTSALKDVSGNLQTPRTMELDSSDNIYICFTGIPGLYKVAAGADREDTPTELLSGTETKILQGNGIIVHPDGSVYVTCLTSRKIYKYKDGETTHVAGDGTDATTNNSDPLQASFSEPTGLCVSTYNDLMICDKNGGLRVMGGYKPFTTYITSTKNIPSYMPLQFWFCRNPGLALPLIALQYHEVKIIVQFADTLNGVTNVEAWADYIFLDTDERRRFAQISHEYLIEQVQFSNKIQIDSSTVTNNQGSEVSSITELRFNHPVKELYWTVNQENDDATGRTQACSKTNQGGTQSIAVDSALLQMNGSDRFEERDGKYFTKVQRYQYHSSAGINTTRLGVGSNDVSSDTVTSKWYPTVANIHSYSFALNPEEHQPSSTCNFSRIDNAILQNKFKTPNVNGTYNYFVSIYAVNYNVLRIMSGMGGLAYSN